MIWRVVNQTISETLKRMLKAVFSIYTFAYI